MEEILDKESSGEENGLLIDSQMKADLMQTTKWTKFLSIMGFIGLALMVLASFVLLALPQRAMRNTDQMGPIAFVYIIMALVYFFPILYLYKFSDRTKKGLESSDQMSLREGFSFLRKHYQYVGVFTIVIISIYILVFLFAIVVSAGKMF